METMSLKDFRAFTRNAKGSTAMTVRLPDGKVAPICDAYIERRVDGSTCRVEVPPTIDGGDE